MQGFNLDINSVKVRRRDREERTKTLKTKKREIFFGCDEESARKRKWKRKRRRGKQKAFVNQERAGERTNG
jgi:hypothetical protein